MDQRNKQKWPSLEIPSISNNTLSHGNHVCYKKFTNLGNCSVCHKITDTITLDSAIKSSVYGALPYRIN